MGILKEEIIFFENVAKRQVQLYPDAADVGVRMLDAEMSVMRTMYKSLAKVSLPKKDFWGDHVKKESMWGCTSRFELPIECDEGCEIGIKLNVDYCGAGVVRAQHKIGHVISIHSERYRKSMTRR